jgi:hypothetical protein
MKNSMNHATVHCNEVVSLVVLCITCGCPSTKTCSALCPGACRFSIAPSTTSTGASSRKLLPFGRRLLLPVALQVVVVVHSICRLARRSMSVAVPLQQFERCQARLCTHSVFIIYHSTVSEAVLLVSVVLAVLLLKHCQTRNRHIA